MCVYIYDVLMCMSACECACLLVSTYVGLGVWTVCHVVVCALVGVWELSCVGVHVCACVRMCVCVCRVYLT